MALLLGRISAMQQALRRSSLVPAGLLWRLRFAIPTRLLSPSGHRKVLVFVRRAGLFRAAFIAITGVGSGTFRCRGGRSSS